MGSEQYRSEDVARQAEEIDMRRTASATLAEQLI
ncbi:hypothetical protein J2858_001836 [Neorhizobium galegae]|nr:hypothetical protein [Neorhizobium galegae]